MVDEITMEEEIVTEKTMVPSSDVCPKDEAFRALLENLVDPLLPFRPSSSEVPSKSLRESVAKQVHAVVLLYNYYHRREHPHLESLTFESFRSLATAIRPALLQHFKESSEEVDSGQTISLEKAIVDACSLSASLDASTDLFCLNKLPVKKVAVLLVDSEKKTCYLQHSFITQGVWSLIEKQKTTAENQNQNEEVTFQKLAFAAIKDATGISHNDIVILERHLVYSLSEEKTTTRFYIMKFISQQNFPGDIPVEDVLDSMQGPLFEKSFSEWATKPIVEYFHVLPYASLIADWFSRREDGEFLIDKEAGAVGDDAESNGVADAEVEADANNAEKLAALLNNPRPRKKPAPRIRNRNWKGRTNVAKGPNYQLRTRIALKDKHVNVDDTNGEEGGLEVEPEPGSKRDRGTVVLKNNVVAERLNSIRKHNAASTSAPAHNSNLNVEELQTTLLSRATLLSQTALKVLLCKRDKLILQQRYIEDEIAECDKSIKSIKDDCELQLETILKCCNEAYPSRTLQESPDKSSAWQSSKRSKLCESLSPTKSSCKKLDNICLENNWALPNYRVSPSDGGFEAEVRMKENHLAVTICGEEKPNPQEARESAAASLLTRLQNIQQQHIN